MTYQPKAVSLDMQDVHELSVNLLSFIESQQVTMGEAVAALALSLGRVVGPDEGVEPEEEVKFIQEFAEYAQLYFTKGTTN